jgi:hypothetical protein
MKCDQLGIANGLANPFRHRSDDCQFLVVVDGTVSAKDPDDWSVSKTIRDPLSVD